MTHRNMRRVAIPVVMAAALGMSACTKGGPGEGMNISAPGAGAGIGAAAGGIIGSLSGAFGWGALVGAGAGALGGYLYDQTTHNRSS